jgi:N-acetylmuramoyl-L-alanine amidase
MNGNVTFDNLNVRETTERNGRFYNLKKLKKLMIATGLMLSMSAFTLTNQSEAATTTHKVQYGESYWKIAKGFGVPIKSLMAANHSKPLYAGHTMVIPNSMISAADKNLMARLVHAEAKGEPYAGKVAVATVILNRLTSSKFPNTIKGIIYQVHSGHYAFTPVQNGSINQAADAASKKAVNEALAFYGKGKGSIYFYNPKISTSKWIFSRPVTTTIGHHRFAK